MGAAHAAWSGEATVELVAAGLADKPRLLALVISEASRRARHAVRTGPIGRWSLAKVSAEDLPLVPDTLLAGDPAAAADIYFGRFTLAGHRVETAGASPFTIEPPSAGWAAELHAFEWLRHPAAVGDALAAANARILVSDWMRIAGARSRFGDHGVEVAARRLIAWLVHSDLLLGEGEDGVFHRRFMRSLAAQQRFLRQAAPEAADGLPRLRARIALAYAVLSLQAGTAAIRLAARQLAEELDRQIFPDGVHLSRDPAAIPTVLSDLLPLARLFEAESQPVPKSLVTAVDRMLPMLRFFRHGDGSLALFNGAGAVDVRLMTVLMRHDETLGEPISHARQGGYQRMSAKGTVLIADTGPPPVPAMAGNAHAGTLAFEFSSGGRRFVVNCGAPAVDDARIRHLARSTAAHSTLVLADRSSSRFETSGALRRFLGAPLIAGPVVVPAAFADDDEGMRIVAAHDGYQSRFGLVHERRIFLSRDGTLIEGTDRLSGDLRGLKPGEPSGAMVRFHLHPTVAVERIADGVRLSAPGGECWSFHADLPVLVEESLFCADAGGMRPSRQLVLAFDPQRLGEVAWCFVRRRQATSCPTADALMRDTPRR